jgi:hypothetical protein
VNEREKFILKMIMAYAHANVDDINEAFSDGDGNVVIHNHDTKVHLTSGAMKEEELAALHKKLDELKLA